MTCCAADFRPYFRYARYENIFLRSSQNVRTPSGVAVRPFSLPKPIRAYYKYRSPRISPGYRAYAVAIARIHARGTRVSLKILSTYLSGVVVIAAALTRPIDNCRGHRPHDPTRIPYGRCGGGTTGRPVFRSFGRSVGRSVGRRARARASA